jgi:type II secretory pathway pseudopilin PulG
MELMVVLAIIAVVALLSYPSYQAWSANQKLRDGVESFLTDLVRARTKAMEEGRAYRCYWETGGGGYHIAPDEMEFWPELSGSAIGPTVSEAASLPGAWQCHQKLPEGISFQGASANPLAAEAGRTSSGNLSGGGEYIVFQANGSTTILLSDGTEPPQIDIMIGNDRGEQRVLRLRAVTSVMTVFNPRLPQP